MAAAQEGTRFPQQLSPKGGFGDGAPPQPLEPSWSVGSPAYSDFADAPARGPELIRGSTWDSRASAPAPSEGKPRGFKHKRRHRVPRSWTASPAGSDRTGTPEGPTWGPSASPPYPINYHPRQAYSLLCPKTGALPFGRPHIGRSSNTGRPPAGAASSEPLVEEEEMLAQEIEEALMQILQRRGLQAHVPSSAPGLADSSHGSTHVPSRAPSQGPHYPPRRAVASKPPAGSTEYPQSAMSPGLHEHEAMTPWGGGSVDVACLGGALAIAIAVSAFGSTSAFAEIGCGHGECAPAVSSTHNVDATAPELH